MNKTIQRPLACRNAHCGAMCSPADASFFGGNPSICLNYERRDDLYREIDLLNKIKQIREEIEQYHNRASDNKQKIAFNSCLKLIDGLIESEE